MDTSALFDSVAIPLSLSFALIHIFVCRVSFSENLGQAVKCCLMITRNSNGCTSADLTLKLITGLFLRTPSDLQLSLVVQVSPVCKGAANLTEPQLVANINIQVHSHRRLLVTGTKCC